MKVYKPISDREVARRLGVRSIHTAYYYLQTIQEIYDAGLIICERLSTDEPQGEWIVHKINGIPHTAECSCCHNHYDYEDLRRIGGVKEIIALPYCPNCGARMKGADDDIDNV